jgi:serine/threonine protein phosphatase PrpC
VLSDNTIYELLETARVNDNIAERLINKALEKESHDNISSLVVLYDL